MFQLLKFLSVLLGSVLTVNDKTENYILDTQPGFHESLQCAVQNHIREEELLWFREEKRVDLKSENKKNSSSVCVSPISEHDNGVTFTCKLRRDQSVSISVVLNVTFAPVLSGDDIQTVEEGSDVKLVCKVKSNPQAQMAWHKNGNILNLETDRHQVQQTSQFLQLTITKTKKYDNGTYTCVANSALDMETKDFHLIVKDRSFNVPMEPIIAACVVVFLTLSFGVIARRHKIMKVLKYFKILSLDVF
ncbi:Transmembrane and immunoglobulin domain-containing protein 1 [Galemys pyrenaicus]|nr:Transmembrane and immunoglobulin domain-containing protein 1 [Galemys pyrenaicus]